MTKPREGSVPETTRKALREYLNSPEGAAFTLETAKRCVQVTKKCWYTCSNCKTRNEVVIDDSRGSIAALSFMHEYSVGKPERDTETVDMTKRLQDMTEREQESLRAQLYPKVGKVLETTRELVAKARGGNQEAIDACLDIVDPGPPRPLTGGA